MEINMEIFAILLVIFFNQAQCQRPSYAGSRPPNGHKDKYRPTQSPETIELANRFGGNALENGATQRPPQGVVVVNSEPVFIPITSNNTQILGTGLSNRFNPDISSQSPTEVPSSSGSLGSTQTSVVPSVVTNRLPLDAQGDQQLIDHLSRLPIDNQPFWFINYQAIEAHRNGSGQNFGPIASRSSFLGK